MSVCSSFSYYSCSYLCLLVVVALFHLCLCNQNFDETLCMEGEREALLEFKNGLVDEVDRLASWVGEESDCCKWAGIVCDNSTGHVNEIHLRALDGHCSAIDFEEASKQKLKGNLSSSLLHLKQLRHLDFSCNDFGWMEVPKFIGSIVNLNYLNLSYSGFHGIIPSQLGNLSELHVLSLGTFLESTSMMNMQWLASLRLLHHLDLSGMDVSKLEWFQVINTLSSLVDLHLSNCQLTDIHQHVFSLNITSLSLLDLSYNNFNSSLPRWIFSIASLVSLDLTRCNFHGPIPSSFRNLTSLQVLHVSENDFMNSSLVLKELSNSNLILLDIRSCGVSSSALDSLYNLTSLLSLDLSQNKLTKTIPKSLCNFCNLKDIHLSYNDFHDISLIYLVESFLKCKTPSLESLTLSSLGLSGYLPSQLGQLVYLKNLVLDNNNISGTIPDSIGMLSLLRTLDLSDNLISGHIPFSIGQLSWLEVLLLSYNQLNGSLPDSIGRLSSLKKLDLTYNQLDGSLPISLGKLSKLEDLSFSSNSLTGVVNETHFAKLVSLKHLYGGGNNLTLRLRHANWIPPFQLQRLNLNSWDLGPQFPLWVQSQKVLDLLDISYTSISSSMPPESFWKSLPNLLYVDMSHNHIKGTLSSIPETVFSLDLSFNEFSGKLPHLSDSWFPRLLDLSNNSFEGSVHHMLCPSEEKGLKVLNLGYNHLSGIIPECWEKWPELKYLNLENNNLSGGIPRTLGSLYNLRSLNMHGNKLSGRLPSTLMNLTDLTILQLGGNELVGSIPTWLGRELYFLTLVNLRSNSFDGNIPPEICYLTYIQILDLADNNLSGNIPRCLNNFSVFSGKQNVSDDPFKYGAVDISEIVTSSDSLVMKGRRDTYSTILPLVVLLDLSNNKLSGDIPSELTALVKLKTLNLSRNLLIGTIPEYIGDMKSLETCDFSMNKLSGELPSSLSSLSFLSSFNVSYNSLTGRVPSSTQLQSLSESSFLGNKLCGPPLTDRCLKAEVPDTQDHEEDDGSHGDDWDLIISMVLGFVVGFWIIVAPLIVSRSWRIGYFRFLSKLRQMVYDVMHKYCFYMFWK